MTTAAAIKTSHDRTIQALKLRPAIGRGTSITTSRLLQGLACEITRGDWTLRADLAPSEGGEGTGPTPSVYGEGALAACLTMGIAIVAAQREIEITKLSVEVASDWDIQGMYGLGDNVPPGYTKIRVTVDLESRATPQEIESLLAEAVRKSPYLDVYRRSNDVTVGLKAKS